MKRKPRKRGKERRQENGSENREARTGSERKGSSGEGGKEGGRKAIFRYTEEKSVMAAMLEISSRSGFSAAHSSSWPKPNCTRTRQKSERKREHTEGQMSFAFCAEGSMR